MEHHDRKEATNEQAGNIEYWYCTLCNNYFLDEKGKQQVEKDKVVISVLPVIPDSEKIVIKIIPAQILPRKNTDQRD